MRPYQVHGQRPRTLYKQTIPTDFYSVHYGTVKHAGTDESGNPKRVTMEGTARMILLNEDQDQ